ncbi:MAG TPA: AbrB/MazE/SpoVT family DNA-binding domain-containing protein [Patescibacteria group bacterium]|nr:AbrB/MazE/SpoVT family DNA-binding domain-containing protein [Patescibacteria group bacterium]
MRELFRMKIASKRQVTIPQRMLNLLRLSEGDELQIEVVDGKIHQTRALKSVPTDLFTEEDLRMISQHEDEIAKGNRIKIDVANLKKKNVTIAGDSSVILDDDKEIA